MQYLSRGQESDALTSAVAAVKQLLQVPPPLHPTCILIAALVLWLWRFRTGNVHANGRLCWAGCSFFFCHCNSKAVSGGMDPSAKKCLLRFLMPGRDFQLCLTAAGCMLAENMGQRVSCCVTDIVEVSSLAQLHCLTKLSLKNCLTLRWMDICSTWLSAFSYLLLEIEINIHFWESGWSLVEVLTSYTVVLAEKGIDRFGQVIVKDILGLQLSFPEMSTERWRLLFKYQWY